MAGTDDMTAMIIAMKRRSYRADCFPWGSLSLLAGYFTLLTLIA